MGFHLPAKLLAAAVALALMPSISLAEQWDMPTGYPAENFHTRNIAAFADDVRSATDGAIDIVVHPNQSLMSLDAIPGAVATGDVPIGAFLLSQLATDDPLFSFDSLPFLAPGYDQAAALWQAARPTIEQALADRGLMLLFSVPWPPQAIYTDRPINTLDDLAGLRIRTYNAETNRLVELIGGIPVEVDASQIGAALARGDLDAIITSSSTGVDQEVWSSLHYYYDIAAWLPRNVVVVNQAALAALSEGQQDAVIGAAATAEQRGLQMSEDENATQLAVLAAHGMEIVTPSADLEASLHAIGAMMTTEWAAQSGAAGATILQDFRGNLR